MLLLIAYVLLYCTKVQAQTTCVPIGTCPTSPTSLLPDPRIISPGTIQCPVGTVPCAVTPPNTSACGVRSTQVTDADGTSQPGAFPWQAFLVNQSTQYFGSGSLIDQYHILTAAHKVASNVNTPSNIKVYLGVWDPAALSTATMKTAVRIVLHPSFNPNSLFNNIAVIRLDSPVTLGQSPYIGCVNLAAAGSSYVGQRCIVAGWGYTSPNPTNVAIIGPQKQVRVPIVDYQTCRTAHSSSASLGANVDAFLDPLGDICAGGEAYKDACTNDGGAPLVCPDATMNRWTAVGIVIWGKGCGAQGLYGVYTNIAQYRSWVDSTVSSLNAG